MQDHCSPLLSKVVDALSRYCDFTTRCSIGTRT